MVSSSSCARNNHNNHNNPGVSFLALQSSDAIHLGVDNLGVLRHVGRLNGRHGSIPFELVKDGDLLLLIERILRLRGLDIVLRELDRLGDNAADEAAGFGRRRVGPVVIASQSDWSLWTLVSCPA